MSLTDEEQSMIEGRLEALGACVGGVMWMQQALDASVTSLQEMWENCPLPEYMAWILWMVPNREHRLGKEYLMREEMLGDHLGKKYGMKCVPYRPDNLRAIEYLVDVSGHHKAHHHLPDIIRKHFPWKYIGPLIIEGFASEEDPRDDDYCIPDDEDPDEAEE